MASSNTRFHSCSYCQHLSIDTCNGQNPPRLSLDDVIAAAGDGCGFFKRRLDLLKQQMPQDEEYTYEDFDSLEMEMSIDLNDGKPVVSCSWVMRSNGYQPDIVDQLLAYTDNHKMFSRRLEIPSITHQSSRSGGIQN